MANIDARTKLTGLLGYPVDHSFSPVMQNAAFMHLGLNYVYLAFPVKAPDLEAVLRGLRGIGIAGLNVTVPHKEAVIPFLDELSPGAEYAGAVNTIVNMDGRLIGHNTDGTGFLKSLEVEGGLSPGGKTFLLLGAGGACRAVASSLALGGSGRIYIANRSFSRAAALAGSINKYRKVAEPVHLDVEALASCAKECDVVINTTSVGMSPDCEKSPLADPFAVLKPSHLVCDLVYNPRRTMLLKQADRLGCRVLTGEGMLLYQGVEAFRLWTGIDPPVEVMRKALKKHLQMVRSGG